MTDYSSLSRRKFICVSSAALAGTAFSLEAQEKIPSKVEPIIDIHQHTGYSGRTDAQLLEHQRTMGVTTTILLPSGRPVKSPSTHNGVANGLEAQCFGNEYCYKFAQAHSKEFLFGANEVPDLPDAIREIKKYLKLGAVIIAEQKFGVECDSPEMQRIYRLAQSYGVPILMHWQFQRFNYGFERFYKMLRKYPKVTFIGHAQTWWANIDRDHKDQRILYPKTQVKTEGLTDRYLADYPNMYADLSAGSGLNSFVRDEEMARDFIRRHQNKLLYGSDCNDAVGSGSGCQGAQIIEAIRRLSGSKEVERKLLYGNAKKLFKL